MLLICNCFDLLFSLRCIFHASSKICLAPVWPRLISTTGRRSEKNVTRQSSLSRTRQQSGKISCFRNRWWGAGAPPFSGGYSFDWLKDYFGNSMLIFILLITATKFRMWQNPNATYSYCTLYSNPECDIRPNVDLPNTCGPLSNISHYLTYAAYYPVLWILND